MTYPSELPHTDLWYSVGFPIHRESPRQNSVVPWVLPSLPGQEFWFPRPILSLATYTDELGSRLGQGGSRWRNHTTGVCSFPPPPRRCTNTTLGRRLWGGIVNSLAFLSRQIKDDGVRPLLLKLR